ncbi:hypothetical protein [Povalibacter sp.]|uniref:hypothetical protein n=1 Tax=Povalibacter sp. TaxID=1962978 RepID=UPI002F42758C
MLYRGVDELADLANKGRLLPKGNVLAVVPRYDGKTRHDGKFTYGPSQSNTARAQHVDSGLYGGCGISTTRSEERAVFFATAGYMQDGYVYVIDESRLSTASISFQEFADPQYPHEQEVTLIEQTGGAIPDSVIVEKYAVQTDGVRK